MAIAIDTALGAANRIVAALAPMCERIEIAGSIRRRRPVVNDIDLVVLPKPGQTRAIKERCLVNCAKVSDGPGIFIVRMPTNPGSPLSGLQVDLFFARRAEEDLLARAPGNWGSVLLCRTGSVAHNIFLVERAKARGLSWNPQYGVYGKCPRTGRTGVCLASESEEDIFAALGLPFLPPERRER